MRPDPLRPQRFIIVAALVIAAAWACWRGIGEPRVVDGDTLVVHGEHIRLHGIDAPEREQMCSHANGALYSCGWSAAARLRQEIGNGTVDCVAHNLDIYGRQVATCMVNGRDLAEAMVRSGWALDAPRYSGGKYLAAETEARLGKRGLWAGQFEPPWTWRRQHAHRAGP